MKLHLPLGLLMALMAAMPIAQGAKTKTFTRENINITGHWEEDTADTVNKGWVKLDLTKLGLPGLSAGLKGGATWVVNFK